MSDVELQAGPSTPRNKPPASSSVSRAATLNASPAYVTTRRHSLYGTEDRIVLDLGSRLWKVGFSGEGKPRDVMYAHNEGDRTLWHLSRPTEQALRDEEDRLLKARMRIQLRRVFHDCLLADPRSRKVIIVEHPLLPHSIKEIMARILFDNLHVPSISFAPSHLLSLVSVGRITGLVLDCGQLESTVLPVFAARPLFPQLKTSPIAGARLNSHIRALLLLFGTYLPPPPTLSGAANIPLSTRSVRVPEEVLTDDVIESIKTRCCFVGKPMDDTETETSQDGRAGEPMDIDSGLREPGSRASSRLPSPSSSRLDSRSPQPSRPPQDGSGGKNRFQALADMYSRHSTASDLKFRVAPPPSQQTGTGNGTLIIPGWIRERAAEVLFEGGDVDEASLPEVILSSLAKIPVDLRRTLASSILITGGSAMLPGFIPRLHEELLWALRRTHSSPEISSRKPRPVYDPYGILRPLVDHIAILNNPTLMTSSPREETQSLPRSSGRAPAFVPSLLPWLGGSLAGALKSGGEEIARDRWDEAQAATAEPEPEFRTERGEHDETELILPDWTRTLLPAGAPPIVTLPRVVVT